VVVYCIFYSIQQKNLPHILPIVRYEFRVFAKSMEEHINLGKFVSPSVLDEIRWFQADNDATGDGEGTSAAGDAWQQAQVKLVAPEAE